jgi:hypothetical protein
LSDTTSKDVQFAILKHSLQFPPDLEGYTWAGWPGGLMGGTIIWEMMSIGMGKMMVLLFSAEMLLSVCR